MNNKDGWIKLYRKSFDNELYYSCAFDKWHAWTDLLLMAESDGRTGKSGTLETTLEALKTRWSWHSRTQVWKFLRTLEETQMVTLKGTPKKTVVTIVKWDFYQGRGNAKKNAFGNAKRTQMETQEYIYKDIYKKNSKEDKEEKEERISSDEEEFISGEEMRKQWNTSST